MKQRVAYAWAVVLLAVALRPSVCSAFTTESLEEVVQVAYDFGLVEVKAGVGNGSSEEVPGYSVYVTYETGPFYGRLGYAAAIGVPSRLGTRSTRALTARRWRGSTIPGIVCGTGNMAPAAVVPCRVPTKPTT